MSTTTVARIRNQYFIVDNHGEACTHCGNTTEGPSLFRCPDKTCQQLFCSAVCLTAHVLERAGKL